MTCKECGATKQKGVCKVCEMFAAGSPPAAAHPAGWPMRSKALGAMGSQVDELNARNRRHGVNVEYQKSSDRDDDAVDCVIPDRNERKKLLKLEGMHDNDGGFGD